VTGTGAALTYTTIAGRHRHEIEVRRSRFIAVLERVESQEQADALLAALRREFHDARHHCSAILIGANRRVQRANDDGEPSGTAGAPMLEALTRRETTDGRTDLSDVAAVVVRYFGGILLGAGGLVRAYSGSVSQALDTAQYVQRERCGVFQVSAPHATAGRLENDLRGAGLTVLGTTYQPSQVLITVAVADSSAELEAFRERLAGMTAGAADAAYVGCEWVDRV
jgi:uncharacterized YigZ family protein